MKALQYLNKYFLKYKYRLLLGILFIILSKVFSMLPAQIIRRIIDYLSTSFSAYEKLPAGSERVAFESDFKLQIAYYALIIIGMALLSGFFLYFQRQTIIAMSRFIEFDLKNEIYQHYQSLPLSFYRKNNTGDLMARISEDVSNVRMYLGPAIMYGLELFVLFAVTIPIMISVSGKLTLYALLPLPVLVFTIYAIHKTMNRRSEEIQKGLSRLSTFVQETFSGLRVIKAFAREKSSAEYFEKESNHYKDTSLKLTQVESFFFPLIMTLTGLSVILIVYVGGLEVIKGNITFGNIAEFIVYLNKLTWPVASLGWTTSLVQKAEASQRRINEFLFTESEIRNGKEPIRDFQSKITFENVSLTYPESGIKALKGISFEIKAGKSIGILGTTGSGKSTIANMLCRMYDPTTGRITIDGKDLRDYDLEQLRQLYGIVPQDVFLFSDTIRNNISFGANEIPEERIIKAAKDADLYHNIIDFPEKFDTIVGERGITLSGGQKQRVSIARALSRDPEILVLDDCLSAVDTKTENNILNNLREILRGRTTVIISHRVSSVKLADHIIVLENGEIVESGDHQTLLELNKVYKAVYQKQLQEETEKEGSLKNL